MLGERRRSTSACRCSRARAAAEQGQAVLFVDVYRGSGVGPQLWRGALRSASSQALLARFLGRGAGRARRSPTTRASAASRARRLEQADAKMIYHVETLLAGAIGASSARVMIASVVEEEPLGLDEVMQMLGETSQAIAYSHELERKSRELEAATRRAARRQRAAPRARPPEGRLRLDRDARAAHAAHVDARASPRSCSTTRSCPRRSASGSCASSSRRSSGSRGSSTRCSTSRRSSPAARSGGSPRSTSAS